MRQFKAIPERQFSDQRVINPVIFSALSYSEARHMVINRLDTSYKWTVCELVEV